MLLIRQHISRELVHLHRLERNAKWLLGAIILYNLIGPIFSIFINAFLWRQSQSLILVALYNLMSYLGVPLGFYLNGVLLRRVKANILYVFGLFLDGVSILLLIFLPHLTIFKVVIFGFLFGLSSGIFWANRNLLTLQTTKSENRIFFASIESNSNTLTGIVVPVVIGWFIAYGPAMHLYTPLWAYKIVALMMILIILLTGTLLLKLIVAPVRPNSLRLPHVDISWKMFRQFEYWLGFSQGASFIPSLMVLYLVGNEGALGLITSLSSLFSVFVVYMMGRSFTVTKRLFLIKLGLISSLIGALLFMIFYSQIGVFLYYIAGSFATPFFWLSISSLNYDLIDRQNRQNKEYAYVCDQEIYLNGGRISAIGIFLLVVFLFSGNLALRFTPLIFALSLMGVVITASIIEKLIRHDI